MAWGRGDVRKLRIPGLVRRRSPLSAVQTFRLSRRELAKAPIPGCAKPDNGARGVGFVRYKTRGELASLACQHPFGYVVQPLVEGTEYRVTICADGTFAVARLLARRSNRSQYLDDSLPRDVVESLAEIVDDLGAPGVGFDVVRDGQTFWLLDANLSPSFAIHARDLAPAYVASWLELSDRPRRRRHSGRQTSTL